VSTAGDIFSLAQGYIFVTYVLAMSKYSILSLDLNKDATSEQRDAFYKKLAEFTWTKIQDPTTLWYCLWKDTTSEAGALQTTKDQVEKAATAAKVKSYDATHAFCDKPVSWSKKG
jgi:hypothetical protein